MCAASKVAFKGWEMLVRLTRVDDKSIGVLVLRPVAVPMSENPIAPSGKYGFDPRAHYHFQNQALSGTNHRQGRLDSVSLAFGPERHPSVHSLPRCGQSLGVRIRWVIRQRPIFG